MDVTQWQCSKGHTLGVIRLNGNRTARLMLYRHAVDLSAEHPAEVDLMIGPLVGQMPVQCDICGDVKIWDVSVNDVEELIRGLSQDELKQLQTRLIQANMERSRRIRSRARFE